ncbi:MAG: hypothetical protein JNJ59_06935 [Deltaproteobacteria bacterium]|jgi:hypothetical protein|nr:hypothetical protein [Deltaproteobacteria bacterium]
MKQPKIATLSKLVTRLALAGACAIVPVAAMPSTSLACGNSYRYELDPKTQMVVKAEEALQEGDYAQAWKLATGATGSVGQKVEGQANPSEIGALRGRTLRVTAIVAVRTRGKVTASADAATQASYTKWAVDQLKILVQREAGNPYLQARLAEGLALGQDGEAEALKILKNLADNDMMPDAAAWLLYAKLSKDAKEQDRGLGQCKLRANDPTICKLEAPGKI